MYFYENYLLKNNYDIIIQNGMIVNLIHLNTNKPVQGHLSHAGKTLQRPFPHSQVL